MPNHRLRIQLLSDRAGSNRRDCLHPARRGRHRLKHTLAIEMLHGLGCRVERDRVYIPRQVVEWGLKNVKPAQRVLQPRRLPRVHLRRRTSALPQRRRLPFLYDLDTGERRRPTVQDIADATRVLDALPNVDVIIPLLGPTDIPSELLAVASTDAMLRNTRKPFSAAAIELPQDVPYVVEMAAACCGGMDAYRQRPTMYISVSPVSPLRFPDDVTSTIIAVAQSGTPFNSLPAPSLGATGPVTLPPRLPNSTPNSWPVSSSRPRPAQARPSPTAHASTPSIRAPPFPPGAARRSAWQGRSPRSSPTAWACRATPSASARARRGSIHSSPTSG